MFTLFKTHKLFSLEFYKCNRVKYYFVINAGTLGVYQ
jgi:hypothetical protein